MTKAFIFSGPLGSGKTTTLNEILSTVPRDVKARVIINDAGYIGTDSQRVLEGFETYAIPGCVCCESSGDLGRALEEQRGKSDVVFIEGTGGANASSLVDEVLSNGEGYEISGVIATVPVQHYAAVSPTVSFNTALEVSNLVRLTWQNGSTDQSLLDSLKGKKVFSQPMSYADLETSKWFPIFQLAQPANIFNLSWQSVHKPHDHLGAHMIPIARDADPEEVRRKIEDLSDLGVERAKGFLPDGRTFDIVQGDLVYQEGSIDASPYLMIISSKSRVEDSVLAGLDEIRAPQWQQSQFFGPNITHANALNAFEYAHRKARRENYVSLSGAIRTDFEGTDTAFRMGLEINTNFGDSLPLSRALEDYVRIRLDGIRSVEDSPLQENAYGLAVLASHAVQTLAEEENGAYPFDQPGAVYLGKYLNEVSRERVVSEAIPAFERNVLRFSGADYERAVSEEMGDYLVDVSFVATKYGGNPESFGEVRSRLRGESL